MVPHLRRLLMRMTPHTKYSTLCFKVFFLFLVHVVKKIGVEDFRGILLAGSAASQQKG
jgi:hypothetical protein